MIIVALPIRTRSESNMREHWACKANRAKEQRGFARIAVQAELTRLPRCVEGYTIHLTRLGRRWLDSDNLATSFKAIRDGIADALGIDDGSSVLTWEYSQKKDKMYGIEIRIAGTCKTDSGSL